MKKPVQLLISILLAVLLSMSVQAQCTANWVLETLQGDWQVMSDVARNLYGLQVEPADIFHIKKVNTNQFAFGNNEPVRIGNSFWYEPNPEGRHFCVCYVGEGEVRLTEDENGVILVKFGSKEGPNIVIRQYIREEPIL